METGKWLMVVRVRVVAALQERERRASAVQRSSAGAKALALVSERLEEDGSASGTGEEDEEGEDPPPAPLRSLSGRLPLQMRDTYNTLPILHPLRCIRPARGCLLWAVRAAITDRSSDQALPPPAAGQCVHRSKASR